MGPELADNGCPKSRPLGALEDVRVVEVGLPMECAW